ncbi:MULTISPECIES: P-loop NTPase fold protein [unclassified Polaromonas]|jgi:hypothetical protein|uniref:P-loop NTPase fold protein n=1 Tax=unclassified Polaromonas TaxID=2638319 RepID=UPI000BD4CE0B|nr:MULTISPECIES: P-loop NTPase fold protein [unclassified Polaromonas]OYY34493.1 MAG: hypothetical protein B7Y60_15495 [Polaromonas sp. 35-63-35]OYZ18820.1 MAG: hypothetical protein B7Y28_14330 [Polaromonas sp. 16-63-31]OYZ78947.1 MAG: hypothetical protein B7Y09_11795 [Polaromonas sp. 24-63-21]OZA49538.1 MAG: hypothetical protein B7X88_14035 [Polaromonas sp. 17-63-33]OZA86919.1 MAG: hypothetical protein B7X65_15785 [Polaromonas sp. 39-63-25]
MTALASEINSHVAESVEAYLALSVPPRFALMLDGPWGSGKTHYVQGLASKLIGEERKTLYVSLYGLTSSAQIDQAIFQQLHPILSSKKIQFAGKLLSGMLKTTLKIDLTSDGAADGSLSMNVPSINIPDYLSSEVEHVLLFDDFERCEIEVNDLLGYINYFVEHAGLKVIIAANQELIEGRNFYDQRREKVVGTTLKLVPDFEAAFASFLSELSGTDFVENIRRNGEIVRSVFLEVGFGNLRSLRQSLLQYQRVFRALPPLASKNAQFYEEFLKLYLVLSLEASKKTLDNETINSLFGSAWFSWLSWAKLPNTNVEPTRGQSFQKKYPWICELSMARQEGKFWTELFVEGHLDQTSLVQLTQAHPAFRTESTPSWKRLWWWERLDQESFDPLLAEVQASFESGKIENVYEALHVSMTILQLTRDGFVRDLTKEEWLETSKRCILSLAGDAAFPLRDHGVPTKLDIFSGYDGLGYPDNDPEFQLLLTYANEALLSHLEKRREVKTSELMGLLESSAVDFSAAMTALENAFEDFPLFSRVTAEEFMKATRNYTTVEQWNTVARGVRVRYSGSALARDGYLPNEYKFFQEVLVLLDRKLSTSRGKILAAGVERFKIHAALFALQRMDEVKTS